jgi:nitrogen regulatory protein P-II 1
MLKIEAIIRPDKLTDVKEALEAIGHNSMTITEVEGRGRQKGVQLEWRVGTYTVEFLDKTKLELVIEDSEKDKVIDAICGAAVTGEVGDGKIFVSEVKEAIRIRTKEAGPESLR